VTHGLARRERRLALNHQQNSAGKNTTHDDHNDVQVPKIANEIAHLLSFLSARVRRCGRRTVIIRFCERQVGSLFEPLLAALP
jgi:hypothetical protein